MATDKNKIIEQKNAITEILHSENGKLLLQYLGELCMSDFGVPYDTAIKYAFSEGRRSVFLALMQLAEKDLAEFTRRLVEEQEANNY